MLIITRKDYNPIEYDKKEWKDSLIEVENEGRQLIMDTFEKEPLGVLAISQMLPKKKEKPMEEYCKQVLDMKFS